MMTNRSNSPIKKHTTAVIESIIAKALSYGPIDNPTIVGTLRELLISDLFGEFLIPDFGVGTGKIINHKEKLSHQIDVIIYDKRILPPLIKSSEIGVFPAESVLAIIEVKSHLSKNDIKKTSKRNEILLRENYDRDSSYYKDLPRLFPFTSIIGFYDELNFDYTNTKENRQQIKNWINTNAPYLWSVCLMGKFSWMKIMEPEGVVNLRVDNLENTKAYLAIMLDNIRSVAKDRYNWYNQKPHLDWYSLYLREQDLGKIFSRQ